MKKQLTTDQLAAHTPGPWEVDDELPPNPNGVIARTTAHHIPISANVGPSDAITEDIDRANAHLIATAPDLLALAKRVAAYFGNQEAGASTEDHPLGVDAARLIAKATAGRFGEVTK